MYYLLPFGIFVQICGWGMNIWVSLLMEGGKIKSQTQYIEGVINVMDMTRMTQKMEHNMFKCKWPNQIKWFCVYLMFLSPLVNLTIYPIYLGPP
jgi:hypothetical protein